MYNWSEFMAIQRLVENYSFDADTYKKIVSSHKITEAEILTIKGNKLSEQTQKLSEDFPSLSTKTVWRMPVARYDNINLNNRKYEKKLWDRVLSEQKEVYQGGIGLADHPLDEEDGRVSNVAIVWLNMGLNESEKVVWAECVFVGQHGKLIEEILEAGGRVGFSSSGFGELDESDHSTVRWDSYILERVADAVLNPSQKVYGNNTMKVKKESIKEAQDTESYSDNQDKESYSIEKCEKCKCDKDECKCDKKEIKQESTMSQETKMSSKDLRKFREDVIEWMNSVPKEDLQEKLKELEEIKSYFSPGVHPDLLAEVNKQIEETRTAIDDAIKEHGKIAKTFGASTVTELKEGVKNLAVDLQLYERDAQDWKEIAEGLQEKNKMLLSVIATRPTAETYKEMILKMKSMKEESDGKLKAFNEYAESLKKKIMEHQTFEKGLIVELEKVNEENTKLTSYSLKLKEYGENLRNKLISYNELKKKNEDMVLNAKLEETKVQFRPKAKAKDYFEGFNESDKVEEYYEDLESRYGKDIVDFKEDIISSKTLKEAMFKFNKIFASLGSDRTRKVSEALDVEERKALIEASSGVKIREHSNFANRVPPTWE
jgi:hypothetical protein